MSTDTHIKKRRDIKKKRKDDSAEDKEPLLQEQLQSKSNPKSTVNSDVNIHVHKEASTGGGIWAKIIFFVLLAILASLIAFLVNEHRGNTELEFKKTSTFRYSKLVKRSIDELAISAEESEDHANEESEGNELETEEEENSTETRSEGDEHKSSELSEANKEDTEEEEEKEEDEGEVEDTDDVLEEAVEMSKELFEDRDENEDEEELDEDQREILFNTRIPKDSAMHEDSEEDKEAFEDNKTSEETATILPTVKTVPKDEIDPKELQEDKEGYHGVKTNQNGSESESDHESDGPQATYQFSDITNADDWIIRDEIDHANNTLNYDAAYALTLFNKLLEKNPLSPRTLYGRAQSLDILAEKKRCNDILQEAIETFHNVLKLPKVPDTLFRLAAQRCINRMRFKGKYLQAVSINTLLMKKFPDEINYRNELAVTYLTINKVSEAKSVLQETLNKWPEDGFALAHYGFILKTENDDLETSVLFLQKGISTRASGVVDGRFYFHLGDALTRLGRKEEALAVYEDGVVNGLFLSKYQRSLYNIARLTGKPWWSKKDFSTQTFFDYLEKNWQFIRNEGLKILNKRGYFKPEAENLRNVGEWKQFELYSRGIKNVANCKQCPKTCEILARFPDATTCRRGQIKFSVMHPGTHVWPHCGPTNCRLRIHLGLKIPINTYIRVADEIRSWEEGKLLIFDDSFEHEVWHNGTSVRLVLIIDVWHPEITKSEKQTITSI